MIGVTVTPFTLPTMASFFRFAHRAACLARCSALGIRGRLLLRRERLLALLRSETEVGQDVRRAAERGLHEADERGEERPHRGALRPLVFELRLHCSLRSVHVTAQRGERLKLKLRLQLRRRERAPHEDHLRDRREVLLRPRDELHREGSLVTLVPSNSRHGVGHSRFRRERPRSYTEPLSEQRRGLLVSPRRREEQCSRSPGRSVRWSYPGRGSREAVLGTIRVRYGGEPEKQALR